MRLVLSFIFLLLLSLPLKGQQLKDYRSDSLNLSLQARYLFVSFGAGVEFPVRQHSYGLQFGYNAVPVDGNIFLDYNFERIGALEYKRYIPSKSKVGRQFYYGSYLLFKDINFASPEESDWNGNWFKAHSLSLGPLIGYKWYRGRRTYFELFLGMHGGRQWGELRWDNRHPDTGQRNPTYKSDTKAAYGIRLGLSFGFHPIRKK